MQLLSENVVLGCLKCTKMYTFQRKTCKIFMGNVPDPILGGTTVPIPDSTRKNLTLKPLVATFGWQRIIRTKLAEIGFILVILYWVKTFGGCCWRSSIGLPQRMFSWGGSFFTMATCNSWSVINYDVA